MPALVAAVQARSGPSFPILAGIDRNAAADRLRVVTGNRAKRR